VAGDDLAMKKYWPWVTWTYRGLETGAWAMIRVSTGLVIATHGVARLFILDPAFGFTKYISALPPAGVGWLELAGGLMLALGLLTRPVALLLAIEWFLFTLGHVPSGRPQSWLMLGAIDHYPAMLTALNLAFLFRGGGRWSLDRAIGREF